MRTPAISGIYRIRNLANSKQYIGSSNDIAARWGYHRTRLRNGVAGEGRPHDNYRLQRAWTRYGEESFVFEIIEECPPERLLEREQHYLDTEQGLYNIARYADAATRGRKLTPEHIEKSRRSNMGRVFPPEVRAKISASRKGKQLSPEHVQALKDAWKRRSREVSPETRAKLSAVWRGRKHSPESRKKISDARKGIQYSPESLAKMSATHKVIGQDPEFRAQMSAKAKERWQNPEYRAHRSAATKALWQDPEFRARVLATRRERSRKGPVVQGVLPL